MTIQMKRGRTWGAVTCATLLACVGVATIATADPAPAPYSIVAEDKVVDIVITNDGQELRGEILEETATEIRMKVFLKVGKIDTTVETTYSKNDIHEIKHDVKVETEDEPHTEPAVKTPKVSEGSSGVIDANTSKVYLCTLKGEFGRDISQTPLEDVLDDAQKMRPDYIVFKVDCDFTFQGQEREEDFPADAAAAFNQLETVRHLQTMLTDDIEYNPDWETAKGKAPTVIFWVNKALGGVAFLPFIVENVYYTEGGRHGNIGYLEHIFDGVGDHRSREKQYSLRLARAVGLANKGGHDAEIVKAMSRADYVLYVRYEGGQPIYSDRVPENEDDWDLLTDDGNEQAGRQDTIQELARFQGNDVLTLDAKTAYRLGLSKGTADTNEELAEELGIDRNYVMLDNRSEDILDRWSERVTDAERSFDRLWRDFNRVQVQQPGGYTERTRARGQQKKILRQIQSLLNRYKEAINPVRIRAAPEQWESAIERMIEQIDQAQRLDERD